MMTTSRDEFTQTTKRALARRVSYHCSLCWKLTSGPHVDPTKFINIGVASHIAAAAPGGKRYDATMSSQERKSIHNGIWLCQSCGDLVDEDELRYTVEILKDRKRKAEERALHELSGTPVPPPISHKPVSYRYSEGADPSSNEVKYNIIYASHVLGRHRNEVEAYFGPLLDVAIAKVGSVPVIINGGEIRGYQYRDYYLSVCYDLAGVIQDIAVEELDHHRYEVGDYFEVFHRLGISVAPAPDEIHPISVVWKNYHGFRLTLALAKINGVVHRARVSMAG